MHHKIIETIEDFELYRSNWKRMFETLREATPFQSFSWNYTWYAHRYKDLKLYIVILYAKTENDPLVICPFMIDGKKCLRFIADTHSDYSTLLVKGMENTTLYDAMKTLRNLIINDDRVETIELKNIAQKDSLIGILTNQFDHKQIVYQTNAISYKNFTTQKELTHCFSYLNSKQRGVLKRVLKKNSDLVLSIYSIEKDLFPKDILAEIASNMRENSLRDSNFLNETLLNVVEALYESGQLLIFELKDENGESHAMNLVLKYPGDSTYLFWIDLYKNRPFVNLAAYIKTILHLCNSEQSDFTVNFGRGLYEYKTKNFLPDIELQFTFFYAKKEWGFIRYMAKTTLLLSIKNFYKKNKKTINKLLRR